MSPVLSEEFLDLLRPSSAETTQVFVNEWRYFTDGEWSMFEQRAAERDAVSNRVEWTRRWSESFNLLGVVGEALFGELTGQERSDRFGDGGEDFPGVDVKATSHHKNPRLLRLATDPLRAEYFALVAVNLEIKRARYVGYATREALAQAPQFEYGYGPTRTLFEEDLLRDLP